jgi:hypothetical protein
LYQKDFEDLSKNPKKRDDFIKLKRHAEFFLLIGLLLEKATDTEPLRDWFRWVDETAVKMETGTTRRAASSVSSNSASATTLSKFPRKRNQSDESALLALLRKTSARRK